MPEKDDYQMETYTLEIPLGARIVSVHYEHPPGVKRHGAGIRHLPVPGVEVKRHIFLVIKPV